jgi:hypothetical protein
MKPDQRKTILAALREGNSRPCAAGLAGMSAAAMRKELTASPAFRKAVEKGEADCEAEIVATLEKCPAGARWLRRRRQQKARVEAPARRVAA